nr:putative ribonuclease H-like domain-containing protein [Tanacetum cinerariifolium]
MLKFRNVLNFELDMYVVVCLEPPLLLTQFPPQRDWHPWWGVIRGIVVRNKARLIAQGHTQEEGINYEEVFALVARIKAIILFLAYSSFMGFMVYQMDVKSAFLYGTIEKEVYVCQPPGFKDPDHPDKVYKVVKALYGLHQAPKAWLTEGKSASTPIDTEKPLLKDPDGEDVDVHIYSYIEYALTVNPNIYVSCIKQFWNTIAVKQSNDVTRLQALVDKKKAVVTEAVIDHVKQKAKEDSFIQRYQVMKKIPQTEAQAQRNMMMYLKNTAGFRLDYFKGMSYDDIRPIFKAKFNANMEFLLKSKEQIEEEANRAIESINETPAQKAAKKRRLNEEAKDVEEIKQHLEILPDKDDDVYTEATPLARKVLVVDYQIVHFNNKPHYKIIHADGTHQLYVRFITLLKNFDREDLESLWSLVKERFSTSKPNNFSDDYLLTTLRAMFGRPDGQDLF